MSTTNTSNNYRDMTKPFTETEVQEFRPLFTSMNTYNADGDYIRTIEFPELCRLMKFERTEETLKTYEQFWAKYYDGKMTWDFFCEGVVMLHDPSQMAVFHAKKFDKNNDGFIQENEFKDLLEMLGAHNPKVTKKTFADFVVEADTNKDGKVSIEECGNWLRQYLTED